MNEIFLWGKGRFIRAIVWACAVYAASCSPDLEKTCKSDQECSEDYVCRSSYCIPKEADETFDAAHAPAIERDWCAPEGKKPDLSSEGLCKADLQPLACRDRPMGRCVKNCHKALCNRPLCGAGIDDLKEDFSSFDYCNEGQMPLFCNGTVEKCIAENQCDVSASWECRHAD